MTTAGPAEPPARVPDGSPDADTGPVRIIGAGRADRPRIGWTEILIAAGVYVVLQVVLTVVALLLNGGRVPASPWLVAISAVCAYGAVAVAGVARVRSAAALGLRRVGFRALLLGLGAGVAVWIVSRGLIIAYVALTGDQSDPQRDLANFGGPVSTVLIVVIGGVVVPLGEELLFRGIGYGGLRRYGPIVATIASGLVFGLAHGLNVVFPAALLLGLVNCVLYERTRSVWTCATAHAVFNLMSFVLALLVR